MPNESAEFRRRVRSIVFAPLLLLLGLTLLLAVATWGLHNASFWVDHTDDVIAHANRLLRLTVDEETGVRGYLLTGDQKFLDPWQDPSGERQQEFDRLTSLTSDNPAQQARLLNLDRAYRDWHDHAALSVRDKQEGKFTENQVRDGKQRMDNIRGIFEDFIAEEDRLKVERQDSHRSALMLLYSALVLVSLGFGGALFMWLRKRLFSIDQEFQSRIEALGKAQSELVDREDRLRVFTQHAPAAIAMFDRDLHLLAASERFVQDYSLAPSTPEQLVGLGHYQLFPTLPKHARDIYDRALAGEDPGVQESIFTRRDGSSDWFRWHVHPWRDAQGKVGGVVLFSQVITESKLSADALEESESRFHQVFNQAPIGMAQVSPTGHFIDVNQQLCAIVGYTRDELLRCSFEDITHPDDVRTDMELYSQLKAGEIPHYVIQKRYIHKSGQIVPVQLKACVVRDASKTPLYALTLVQQVPALRVVTAAS